MRPDRNRENLLRKLAFYASEEHPCSYLPDRQTVLLFADPSARITNALYSRLADHGFRRSGQHVYRPSCPGCAACVPVRIPVEEFTPRRNQRRVARNNRDLDVIVSAPEFRLEHFRLYRRYIQQRHRGGGMDDPDPERYLEFLTSPWSETRFYEFRHAGRLVAVAVVDHLAQALSAVYTFFDPALADAQSGHLCDPLGDRRSATSRAALGVSRLLDRGVREDELQGQLPAARGTAQRALEPFVLSAAKFGGVQRNRLLLDR